MTLSLRARLFLAHRARRHRSRSGSPPCWRRASSAAGSSSATGDCWRAATERAARGIAARPPDAPARLSGLAASLAAVHGRRVTLIDSSGRVRRRLRGPARGASRALENHARPARGRAPRWQAAPARRRGTAPRSASTCSTSRSRRGACPASRCVRARRAAARARARRRRRWRGPSLLAAVLSFVMILGVVAWLTGRHARAHPRAGGGHAAARRRRARRARARASGRRARPARPRAQRMAAELQTRARGAGARARRARAHPRPHDRRRRAGRRRRPRSSTRTTASPRSLGAALPPAPGTPFQDFARIARARRAAAHGARRRASTVEHDLRLWTPRQRLRARDARHALAGREAGAVLLVLHDLTEIERLEPGAAGLRRQRLARAAHAAHVAARLRRDAARAAASTTLEHREGFVRMIRDQAMRLAGPGRGPALARRARAPRRAAAARALRSARRWSSAQVAQLPRPRAARAGLALALEPGGAGAGRRADRARIEQVIANLLDNALKYTERGGVTVAVGGRATASPWCEVRDTGPGIPADDLPRDLRALLSRRQGALAREGRHRTRALDREAHRRAPRRRGRGPEHARLGQHRSASICRSAEADPTDARTRRPPGCRNVTAT